MKKGLIFLIGIISFLGINKVSAAEIKLNYEDNINEVQSAIELVGADLVKNEINYLIETYNTNYKDEYPYYFISLYYIPANQYNDAVLNIDLTYIKDFSHTDYFPNYYANNNCGLILHYDKEGAIGSSISIPSKEINRNNTLISHSFFCADSNSLFPYEYYYSNFDYIFKGSLYTDDIVNSTWKLSFLPTDTFYIPTFKDSSLYLTYQANEDFLVEPYYLYDDILSMNFPEELYTTIDLNQYPYIALSLKNYSATEQFYTNMYVQGQLCLTPIYNYGMTEKTEYYSSYQVQRCSSYYETSTLTRVYILADDLKNNAIYYLKAYDTSKENIVKVDTSVFDITYITEETQDNPYVSIGGKTYPTIAYDNLTSSATKSEDEDYVSGVSCQVGDFNCYTEYNPSNVFNDLFDKPLEMLKTVWGAIVSIFELIGQFIALLPPTMQGFLYIAFGISIILGIIKVLV